MSIRVHKLAKELALTSKDLIAKLKALGVKVKGHMSALDAETAEIIRHEFKSEKKPRPPKAGRAGKKPRPLKAGRAIPPPAEKIARRR